MDQNLMVIFPFVAVIVLMVFVFARGMYHRVATHEERKLELIARAEEARSAKPGPGADAYRKLEERVRVLERIATDSNTALAAQIEQLRDLNPPVEQMQDREIAR